MCFKNSAKITTLCFRGWLINMQLQSVLLVMPVVKRKNFKISLSSKKWGSSGFILLIQDIGKQRNSQCCVNYILKKYLKQGEKCTLQWSMSHVTTVYPQKHLNKLSLLPTQQTTHSLPGKRFFYARFFYASMNFHAICLKQWDNTKYLRNSMMKKQLHTPNVNHSTFSTWTESSLAAL